MRQAEPATEYLSGDYLHIRFSIFPTHPSLTTGFSILNKQHYISVTKKYQNIQKRYPFHLNVTYL